MNESKQFNSVGFSVHRFGLCNPRLNRLPQLNSFSNKLGSNFLRRRNISEFVDIEFLFFKGFKSEMFVVLGVLFASRFVKRVWDFRGNSSTNWVPLFRCECCHWREKKPPLFSPSSLSVWTAACHKWGRIHDRGSRELMALFLKSGAIFARSASEARILSSSSSSILMLCSLPRAMLLRELLLGATRWFL